MPEHQLTLRLDAMAYGGDAIGRTEGKAVFVQGGIAGERVRVEMVQDRARFARGRAVEIVEPSPDRVQPRCPHFGFNPHSCGGCHWQHIDYAAQVRFKTDIVREQFRRLGRIDPAPVRDTIPSPEEWAYRNTAQFSVTPDGRLGFLAARSHRIVPVQTCDVVQMPIAAWLQAAGRVDGDRVEARFFEDGGLRVWKPGLHLPPAGQTIKGVKFRVSTKSFFQVNTCLVETMVNLVLRGLDLRGVEIVLDGYCGVGLFARHMASQARRVIGVELDPNAMADARENLAWLENVELREGPMETVLPELAGPIDAAVVDPPRAGCGPKVIAALIDRPVRRLVYASCDPSTLARDARQLLDGGYRLVEVQPLDMFPQTYHIESISVFTR